MIFKRLEIGILGRLPGLSAALYGALYAAQHGLYGLLLGAGVALLLLALELARYVTRANKELADFLLAVKYRDFSQHFNEAHPNRALRPLYAAFNQINATFRQLSNDQETHSQYLQTVLELIDTGIISYDAAGEVEWLNEAFKRTLELPYLKNVQTLRRRHAVLHDAIRELRPGSSAVVKLTVGPKTMQLLLSATAFRLRGQPFTLVAFKNVSHALDETQTEAWQKLLRVMTHEIMNSVAPIASLADTLHRHLRREIDQVPAPPRPDPALLNDVAEGISIIQHRSEGLLKFAQVYRDISKITTPLLTTVYVQELLRSIRGLLKAQLEAENVELLVAVQPADLLLQADSQLLEQLLINLVLNAAYAVRDAARPQIQLVARREEERVVLEVADNGTGIPPALLDSIFIPFFTTRPHGSGIGLSLAKQIVHLHRGNIRVRSVVGQGTVFRVEL